MSLQPEIVGVILLLLAFLYLLMLCGYKLAKGETGYSFWVYGSFAIGTLVLIDRNPVGYVALIPLATMLIVKAARSQVPDDTRKRIKGVILSGIASVGTYAATHALFGFGAMEASLSAFLAAMVLGFVGYSS
jgi:hypothetical protein